MERILAKALVYWWVVLIVVVGLGGNGYLAVKCLIAGQFVPASLFAICFVGACVYCHRTWNALDEIRGIFRD